MKIKKTGIAVALIALGISSFFIYGTITSETQGNDMDNKNRKTNRLIDEQSPYLLQHAYNPVDWYPWGKEAIEKARKEDKPILVSIGYSTCHWCHVMEHESFEDPVVAEIMNKYFICIKVDREGRPDIDSIYMTALTVMTGSGGWPLNVFLQPDDLKPFFGGTYFPKETRYNITGWKELLKNIADVWSDPLKRKKLSASAGQITDFTKEFLEGKKDVGEKLPLESVIFNKAFNNYVSSYDKTYGGFSKAPKFPSPSNQDFLMQLGSFGGIEYFSDTEKKEALNMTVNTLRSIANGGIFDHIGGGFHRYATDSTWHVPHFEKMLYDNAQLIENYIDAYSITNDVFFLETAERTLNYIIRDMTHNDGGFYSAEDADSYPKENGNKHEKKEGAFYVWSYDEIKKVLGSNSAKIFSYHYGVRENGNAAYDPSGEFDGQNILYAAKTINETAEKFSLSLSEAETLITEARESLRAVRDKRPRPHLDDKVITAWNGLMISAAARAYQVTEKDEYLNAAKRGADFIYHHLYDRKKGELYRIWRNGEKKIPGLASDYAFLTKGLINLYEASFDARWLDWAIRLSEDQLTLFYDKKNGGFFMTREGHDSNLIIRVKDETDSVIPSAGSVAASNLIRLNRYADRQDFATAAEKTIISALSPLEKGAAASPQMLISFGIFNAKDVKVIVAGRKENDRTKGLLAAAKTVPIQGRTIILIDTDENKNILKTFIPYIENIEIAENSSAAYVCYDHACRQPVDNPDSLLRQLEEFLRKGKSKKPEKAIFGAGCFWKPEIIFGTVKGVASTSVGYMGGDSANPTYEDVCTGKTGHAEVVEVEYDPGIISYSELLDMFWKIHDPTTLNMQGADIGTQYRSAIFYTSKEQKNLAEGSKKILDTSDRYEDRIVTEILPAGVFYRAEEYHQQYFKRNIKTSYGLYL